MPRGPAGAARPGRCGPARRGATGGPGSPCPTRGRRTPRHHLRLGRPITTAGAVFVACCATPTGPRGRNRARRQESWRGTHRAPAPAPGTGRRPGRDRRTGTGTPHGVRAPPSSGTVRARFTVRAQFGRGGTRQYSSGTAKFGHRQVRAPPSSGAVALDSTVRARFTGRPPAPGAVHTAGAGPHGRRRALTLGGLSLRLPRVGRHPTARGGYPWASICSVRPTPRRGSKGS
jgi:hypothetical protein